MDFSPRFFLPAGYRNIVYREGKKVRDQTGFRLLRQRIQKRKDLRHKLGLWF